MRGETAAALRRKHMLGERVLLGHIPIRRNLRRLGVLVWIKALRFPRSRDDGIEAVHRAAVARGVVPLVGMNEIRRLAVELRDKVARLERDALRFGNSTLRVRLGLTSSRAVGTLEGREKIVEGTVLLNDDHDVLDRRGFGTRLPVCSCN